MVATITVQLILEGDLANIGEKAARIRAVCETEAAGHSLIRFEERFGAPRGRVTARTTQRAQDAGDGSPEGSEAAMEAAGEVNDEAAGIGVRGAPLG